MTKLFKPMLLMLLSGAPLSTSAAQAPPGQTSADVPSPAAAQGGPSGGSEIIVTATRQSQALSKVPISISAFTGARLEMLGLKSLRGPQGTLFGAGSEGGTVRYITPQPSLTKYTGYARTEVSATEHGAPSAEGGVALGGPILTGKLGFRASAYYRRDGGYINRIDTQTGHSSEHDANSVDTYVLRGALAWVPSDILTITPSIVYQNRNRRLNDRYWIGISDAVRGRFLNGTPDRQADKDKFLLSALKIELDLHGVEVVSNTSYYDRTELTNGDSGTLYTLSFFQQLLTNSNGDGTIGQNLTGSPYNNPTQAASAAGYPLLGPIGINLPQFPGYQARTFILNQQKNFAQEIRVQSNASGARFVWVVGIFYGKNKQVSQERINDPLLPQLTPVLFGGAFPDFTGGNPLTASGDSYFTRTLGYDEQLAFFADGTYGITDKIKITAGVRYALTKFSFQNSADGSQNLGFSSGTGAKKETPFTPKIGVQWQPNPNNLFTEP